MTHEQLRAFFVSFDSNSGSGSGKPPPDPFFSSPLNLCKPTVWPVGTKDVLVAMLAFAGKIPLKNPFALMSVLSNPELRM